MTNASEIKSCIYAIENGANGHCYIGSAKNFYARQRTHLRRLRNNTHHSPYLQRAWNMYGENKFSFTPLIVCEPFELLRYEQALIDIRHPEYNIEQTAGSSLGRLPSPETRAKMGHEVSTETREKISSTLRGKPCQEEGTQ